jgi:hypothetical protein
MSLYVHWMNLIKEKATSDWLTDGQRAAYDPIISQWATRAFINICGPPGCGKSFVARLLAQEHDYVYTHDLQSTPPNTKNAVVDDAEYTRLMRATAQVLGIGRVILVTQTPVKDPMPRAEIRLTERDVRQFLHNLYTCCGIQFLASNPTGTDLSQILRAEVIARGGNDVD